MAGRASGRGETPASAVTHVGLVSQRANTNPSPSPTTGLHAQASLEEDLASHHQDENWMAEDPASAVTRVGLVSQRANTNFPPSPTTGLHAQARTEDDPASLPQLEDCMTEDPASTPLEEETRSLEQSGEGMSIDSAYTTDVLRQALETPVPSKNKDWGKKRPAPDTVNQIRAQYEARRREKREKAQLAIQAVYAPSTPAPTADPAPPINTGTTTGAVKEISDSKSETAPFDFRSVANSGFKTSCAFSVDNGRAVGRIFGKLKAQTFDLRILPGRYGDPKLSLIWRINTQEMEKLFDPVRAHETMTITWYPGAESVVNRIYNIVIRTWEELAAVRDYISSNYPFMNGLDPAITNMRAIAVAVVGAEVKCSCNSSFFLSKAVTDLFDEEDYKAMQGLFSSETERVVTFFVPFPNRLSVQMQRFEQCVLEGRGLYHQYRENGTGKWKLDKWSTTETIEQVGGNMYAKNKKQEGYFQLPQPDVYRCKEEFLVPSVLVPIREAQFMFGRNVSLRHLKLAFFLYEPRKSIRPYKKDLPKEYKEFDDWAQAYFRLPSVGKNDLMPEVNSKITLQVIPQSNFSGNGAKSKQKEYIGRVVTVNSDDLALTGTDFCVFMRIPKADGLKRNSQLFKNMPMKVGTVSLEINLDPLEREIDATNEMMESEAPFHREFLDHILDLPSGTVVNVTDLSKGPSKPPSKYAMKSDNSPLFDTLADIIKGILNNAAQAAIVDGLKTVEGRYMGVIGPSGTGKTSVIKYVVWLLVAVGHKIAVCAPSNQALDHVTRSLNDTKRYLVGKHPEFANALKGKEMCRLEIGSIERMRMRHGDVGDDVTWTNRPTDSTIDSMVDELVWSDPRVQEAANLLAEFAGDAITEAEFDDFVGGYTTMRSIQAESEMRRARRPEVPYECTLGYWINTHCKEDEAKAREAYDQEKSRFGIFHEGDNPDVAEHNPSDTYNGWKYEFLSREGKLNSEEMKQFRLARQRMEQRVMDRMSILVVTLSSAKSEHTAGMGFKATAIIVDEAAQASFSSLFVAMTAFPEADGIVMFGDPLQLKPFAMAKAATEVRGFAEESPLQRARTRKGPVRYLTVQYRMAPSIGEFPSKHFYEGKMIPHDNAKLDNPIRKCVRELSKESYGIGGQNGYGSECFMVSIERGFARLEPRGTSLQNHGNADAICLALDRLLAKGVPAREIGIITLYKAQMKVIASRIGKTNDGQAKYDEMSTVDAFQGREKSIILLDLVVGKSYESYDTAGKYDEGPSDDDIEAGEIAPGSAGRKYNFITAFARDPHRLCVALTRAMDGFIVFGQQASLLELGRRAKKANPLASTLYELVRNFRERRLVFHDTTTMDSSN